MQESNIARASHCIIDSLQMRKMATTDIIKTPRSETPQFSEEDTLSSSSASTEIKSRLNFQNIIISTNSHQATTKTPVRTNPASIEKLPSQEFTVTGSIETLHISDKETLSSLAALPVFKRQLDLKKTTTETNLNQSNDWSSRKAIVSCVHTDLDNQKLIVDDDLYKKNEKSTKALEQSLENDVLNMNKRLRLQSEDYQYNAESSHLRDKMYLAHVDSDIDKKNANQNSLDPNIVIIEGWPDIDDKLNCTGTCKVRIDMNSPRFICKSIDEIIGDMSLISDSDKFERTNDRGIFEITDHFIAEEIADLKNLQKCGCKMAEAEGKDGDAEKTSEPKNIDENAAATSEPANEENPKETSDSKNMDVRAHKLETDKNLSICTIELTQNAGYKFRNHSEQKHINDTNSKQAKARVLQAPKVCRIYPEPDSQKIIVDSDLGLQHVNASKKLQQSVGDETNNTNQNELDPDIIIIEGWPEIDDESNCTGTCKTNYKKNEKSTKALEQSLNENDVLNMNKRLRLQSEDYQYNAESSHLRDKMYLAHVDSDIDKKNANQNSLDTNIVIIEGWPDIDDKLNCTGTCKVRIDMNSPRFICKSIDEIIGDMSLISDSDKFERTNDRGIFEITDHFIAEEIADLKNLQKFGCKMAEAEGKDGDAEKTSEPKNIDENAAATSEPANEENPKETSDSKNMDVRAHKLEIDKNLSICTIELTQNAGYKFRNHSEQKHINDTNSKQAKARVLQAPKVCRIYPEPDSQKIIVDSDLGLQHVNASKKLQQSVGDETNNTNQNELDPDIIIIEGWPEIDDESNCTGTCKTNYKKNEKSTKALEQSLNENDVLNMNKRLRLQSEDYQYNAESSHLRDKMYLAHVDSDIDKKNANQNSLDPNIVIIEGWPDIDDKLNCTGTCKVRIDMNSPRFICKSIDEIIGDMSLISDSDKFERTNDRGIFEITDRFIAEEIADLKNLQKFGCKMAEAEGKDGDAEKTSEPKNIDENAAAFSEPANEENPKETSDSKNMNVRAHKLEIDKSLSICTTELTQNAGYKFRNHSEQKHINDTNSKQAKARVLQAPKVCRIYPEPDSQKIIVDSDLGLQHVNASKNLQQSGGDETNNTNQNELDPDIIIIEGWPEIDDESNCTGTCKVRIDMNSPRFVGKTLYDICGNMSLISGTDKFERNNSRDIIEIAEEMAKLKNSKKGKGKMTESEEKAESSVFQSEEDNAAKTSEFTNMEEDAPEISEQTNMKEDAEKILENSFIEDLEELTAVKSLTIHTQELPQAVGGKLSCHSGQSAAEQKLTDVDQNSLITSEYDDNTDFITIEKWPEFDDNGNCIGMATVRIDLKSPRFAGKTFEDIFSTERSLITDADKVRRTDDIGIFREVDAIIAEFKNPEI